jgi:hypothetical protein
MTYAEIKADQSKSVLRVVNNGCLSRDVRSISIITLIYRKTFNDYLLVGEAKALM